MKIKWGRAVAAALAAEVLGVAFLALLVALFGPPGFKEAMPFAERLGAWGGPLSGFALCVLGGWWTAKAVSPINRLRNGLVMGVLAAVLDIVIALAMGAGIAPLLLVSNAGRVVAGAIGGWIAARPGA